MASQYDLALSRQLHGWLPDETLFSWCSRYHLMAVNGLASVTCLQLFGHRTAGAAHDLPCRIDEFVQRTRGQLGGAREVLAHHTLLSYYLPFKPESRSEEIFEILRGVNAATVKYRLGLLTGGLPADHPLKACPACMDADKRVFGMAYWHRVHQLPTVFLCPTHAERLLVSPLKIRQVARFQWTLPSQACLAKHTLDGTRSAKGAIARLQLLAKMSAAVLAAAPGAFAEEDRLAAVFRQRLHQLGLVSGAGRIGWPRLLGDVERRLAFLAAVPGMGERLWCACKAQSALTRMLSGRSLMHPCRYLAWASAYFADWQDFLASYEKDGPAPGEQADPKVYKVAHCPQDAGLRTQAIEMIVQGGKSVTGTAASLDVDFQTVAVWAAQAGIAPNRRAKQLKPKLLLRLIGGLQAGEEKKVLAKQCHVSVVTVTRILRTEPGLSEHWHQVRFDRTRKAARSRWLEMAQGAGALGVQALRRISPSHYAWLYRNDRTWLANCNANLPKPAHSSNGNPPEKPAL